MAQTIISKQYWWTWVAQQCLLLLNTVYSAISIHVMKGHTDTLILTVWSYACAMENISSHGI